MKTLLKNRELSAFLAILALFAVLVALNPSYFSLQTLGMIFASSQILILLAIGAALVMLTRQYRRVRRLHRRAVRHRRRVALNSGYSLRFPFSSRCLLARWPGRSTVFWWWGCASRRLSPPSARWGCTAGQCCSGPRKVD